MDYLKRVRIVALASLALVGLLLLIPCFVRGVWWSDVKFLLIGVVGLFSFIMLVFPPPPPQQKRSELCEKERDEEGEIMMVASIACYGGGCGHVGGRLFQRGDYVRKVVGRCPRCGGELYVKAIYVPPLKIGEGD